MTNLARAALLPLVAMIVSAAPAPRVIPLPGVPDEALIIPTDSPVKFHRWDKYGYAEFDGRFVLTGTFTYGNNEADYEGPLKDDDLEFRMVPDPQFAARLPNWKIRHNDMFILIKRGSMLGHSITSSREHAAILAGKIHGVHGRISIVVDNFRTGIECDSANFTARFVAVSKAPRLVQVEFKGDYGCA